MDLTSQSIGIIAAWLFLLLITYPYSYYKNKLHPYLLYTIFGLFLVVFLAPLYVWFFNFPESFTVTFTSVAFVLYVVFYFIIINKRKKSKEN
jgi:L-asparagine transporter-like permease